MLLLLSISFRWHHLFLMEVWVMFSEWMQYLTRLLSANMRKLEKFLSFEILFRFLRNCYYCPNHYQNNSSFNISNSIPNPSIIKFSSALTFHILISRNSKTDNPALLLLFVYYCNTILSIFQTFICLYREDP